MTYADHVDIFFLLLTVIAVSLVAIAGVTLYKIGFFAAVKNLLIRILLCLG